MSVILYPNGIIEQFKPTKYSYTEEELINILKDFSVLRSKRMIEIPDTWILWGENKKFNDEDYNRLASIMLDEDICSPILFLHDTEIDPSWDIINKPIFKNYGDFVTNIVTYINNYSQMIIDVDREQEEELGISNNKIILNNIGTTDDRRILFEFNPSTQNPDFLKPESFNTFADKVFSYVKNYYKKNKPFVVWADNKYIILVEDNNVNDVIDKVNDSLEKRERYEDCNELKIIKDYWNNILNKPKKRKSNAKKSEKK